MKKYEEPNLDKLLFDVEDTTNSESNNRTLTEFNPDGETGEEEIGIGDLIP